MIPISVANLISRRNSVLSYRPEHAQGLGVRFEVITAEPAQAYKLDHRLFAYAFQRLGCQAADVLHIGAGYPTNMALAFELGIAHIWINRRRETHDPTKPPTFRCASNVFCKTIAI